MQGIESIKKYVSWCRSLGLRPQDAKNVFAYDKYLKTI